MATFKQDPSVQRVGNQSHLSHLSSGLNQSRQQASFCDVNIIVGDQRFPAHKVVLSSASDYFQRMFSSGFQESTMGEVTVPGTEESFAQILDFAYTGYFTLSLQTVVDILKMACYMVFTEAMELCADYLKKFKKNLTKEDCFEIWSIAINHGSLSDIAEMCRSHVLQNFPKLAKSGSFLENSSASVMIELLSDEEIETDDTTEEQILQAALSWLKYDWEQRKVHAVDILKKIRLGLVSVERLKEIFDDELLSIPECKDMMEEVVKLTATKDTATPPLIISHPKLFASRNTITAKVYDRHGVGYQNNSGLDDFYGSFSSSKRTLSLRCQTKTGCCKMTKLADIPDKYPNSPEIHVKPYVSNRNELYALVDIDYGENTEDDANHDKWQYGNNFYQYMPEKNEWIALPPARKQMNCRCEIFQVGDYLYFIECDSDEYFSESAILRFDILNKSWEICIDDIMMSLHRANLLSTGQILINGTAKRYRVGKRGKRFAYCEERGYEFLLYKPATNELLDVTVETDVCRLAFFMEDEDNNCYMVTCHPHKGIDRQINRVICNFDSDKPSMVVADVVEDEALDDTRARFFLEYTFDKRKLGLVQVRCKCKSHLQSKKKTTRTKLGERKVRNEKLCSTFHVGARP